MMESQIEIDRLARELRGVTEMLVQVLNEVGEPITVSKEGLRQGLPGVGISIDEHTDAFIFTLVKE